MHMRATDRSVREERERIEWAEADGARCPFDRDLVFAQIGVEIRQFRAG